MIQNEPPPQDGVIQTDPTQETTGVMIEEFHFEFSVNIRPCLGYCGRRLVGEMCYIL